MAASQQRQVIPTSLGFAQFQEFVLPNPIVGSRGPAVTACDAEIVPLQQRIETVADDADMEEV